MRTTALWSAASSLLVLLTAPATGAATTTTTIRIAIPPSQLLQNPAALPPATHATLTTLGRPSLSAPLDAADRFVFANVTAGSYLADVHCPLYSFAPLRVDVGPFEDALKVRVWETYRGNDWENKGEEVPEKKRHGATEGQGVYEARVVGKKIFFQERTTFSVINILKNPMMLMGIVSLAMFIGVPKLIENMDPETRAEFEAQRRENPVATLMAGGTPGGGGSGGGGAASGANFDVAGFLSGHSASKNDGRTPSPGPAADVAGDAVEGSGKSGKKRK
ncbi:ER membrane protein complex subunit 7 [Microdochium nivale]|nr:ER membrane protein complex subunit 7 [Microdochium nivale]